MEMRERADLSGWREKFVIVWEISCERGVSCGLEVREGNEESGVQWLDLRREAS